MESLEIDYKEKSLYKYSQEKEILTRVRVYHSILFVVHMFYSDFHQLDRLIEQEVDLFDANIHRSDSNRSVYKSN